MKDVVEPVPIDVGQPLQSEISNLKSQRRRAPLVAPHRRRVTVLGRFHHLWLPRFDGHLDAASEPRPLPARPSGRTGTNRRHASRQERARRVVLKTGAKPGICGGKGTLPAGGGTRFEKGSLFSAFHPLPKPGTAPSKPVCNFPGYVQRIYEKLHVRSRCEIIALRKGGAEGADPACQHA